MEPLAWAALAAAVVLGAAAAWLWSVRRGLEATLGAERDLRARAEAELDAAGARLEQSESDLERTRAELTVTAARAIALEADVRSTGAILDAERRHFDTRIAEQRRAAEDAAKEFRERLADVERASREAFKALAADALKDNGAAFLAMAREAMSAEQQKAAGAMERGRLAVESLVRPISETMQKTNERIEQIGRGWTEDKATLTERLSSMGAAAEQLRSETGKLVRALREPHVRGRYGELQLKRVVELTGLTESAQWQDHTVDEDGRPLRPDLVIAIPGGRSLVVDAKTNIKAYLDAVEAPDAESAGRCMERFADHVADQATALAKKTYWKQYDGSPEIVVMFVPGDQFLDAAHQRRPDLLEHAGRQGVIFATPSTLIGIIRAIQLAFMEQRLVSEAAELRELGKKLHHQASTAMEHIERLGEALQRANENYNKFLASYQSRLEPTLRRFEDAGVSSAKELPAPAEIIVTPRAFAAERVV